MSFLLDALGKADHDRRRADVPELKTYNQDNRSSLRRSLRAFVLMSLLLISFVLGYFMRPYLEPVLFEGSSVNTGSVPETRDTQAKSTPVLDPSPVEQIAPPEVVARVLELEVISHSDVPAVRFAMINGVVVHEGDVLSTGERLLKIEPNAVVLDRAGVELRISM